MYVIYVLSGGLLPSGVSTDRMKHQPQVGPTQVHLLVQLWKTISGVSIGMALILQTSRIPQPRWPKTSLSFQRRKSKNGSEPILSWRVWNGKLKMTFFSARFRKQKMTISFLSKMFPTTICINPNLHVQGWILWKNASENIWRAILDLMTRVDNTKPPLWITAHIKSAGKTQQVG